MPLARATPWSSNESSLPIQCRARPRRAIKGPLSLKALGSPIRTVRYTHASSPAGRHLKLRTVKVCREIAAAIAVMCATTIFPAIGVQAQNSVRVQPGQPTQQSPPGQNSSPPLQAGTAPASPQTPAQSPDARRISLQEAFTIAERQNLDLAASRLQRAVALAGIRIAGERPNPTVSVAATRDTPHESAFFDLPLEVWGQR